MGERHSGLGGRAAVAAAAGLLAVCAAGGPLYVSSSASQAVQVQLADGCLADDGMHLQLGPDAAAQAAIDTAAATVPHVAHPVVTAISQAYFFTAARSNDRQRLILMHRDGQQSNLGPGPKPVRPGQVLLPDWYAASRHLKPGDYLAITVPAPIVYDTNNVPLPDQPPPSTMRLTVAGTYPVIPTRPEPAFWCAQRAFFRPNQFGDLPTPVGFVDASTFGHVPFEQLDVDWELRPDPAGMTRDQARQLSKHYAGLAALYGAAASVTVRQLRVLDQYTSGIEDVIGHAQTLSRVVARTVAPVRLTGIAASIGLLCAAGVLLARERRRDLRLRLLRGVGPARLATQMAAAAAPAAVIGTVVGLGLAVLSVVTVGPTPELEGRVVRQAVGATAIGCLVAVIVVGVVSAATANATVDGRRRAWSPRQLILPGLVALVVLTLASYVRLDRAGGVRLVGSEAMGGDLLAQAFPLLAVAAPLVLLAGPAVFLLRRSRFVGRGLRPALLLGIRRVVIEPAVTVMLVTAVALAAGTYFVASSLTASAEQTLVDKADTYLGSDLVAGTLAGSSLPAGLADRATIVDRAAFRSGEYGVDLLAVDPGTFARAVRWRDDAASVSLARLLDDLHQPVASGRPLPAVVIGRPLDVTRLRSVQGFELPVAPVHTAAFFPGYRNGATLVVVARDALPPKMPGLAPEVWVRDPPDDAVDQLRAGGFSILSTTRQADVFDVTSFLTVRWSYGALAAFGLLVALVVLVAQLLVLDARRGPRQAAFVLTNRMGHRARDEALAVLTELALPLLAGIAIGTAIGVGVCHVAVRRLDSLRQLTPPARVVVDTVSMAPLALAAVAALGLMTVIGVVSVVRARPMEVLRATA